MAAPASISCRPPSPSTRARCCRAFQRAAHQLEADDAVRELHVRGPRNHADGPFSVPANGGRHASEWGPSSTDVRHRFNTSLNNQIVRNLLVALNLNVNTGNAYSIRTGRDDNADFVFNDRPGNLGRNTERGATQWSLNPFIGYVFVVRPEHLEPAARDRRHRRRGRRRSHGADRESAGEPLPAASVPAGPEHHQPRQLHRLQRDDDLAVLQAAHQRARDAEDRYRDVVDVLSWGRARYFDRSLNRPGISSRRRS